MDDSTRKALYFLQENFNDEYFLVSNQNINYLASAYTLLKPIFGHDFNTPESEKRKADFKEITESFRFQSLDGKKVVFVIDKNNPDFLQAITALKTYKLRLQNQGYFVFSN